MSYFIEATRIKARGRRDNTWHKWTQSVYFTKSMSTESLFIVCVVVTVVGSRCVCVCSILYIFNLSLLKLVMAACAFIVFVPVTTFHNAPLNLAVMTVERYVDFAFVQDMLK